MDYALGFMFDATVTKLAMIEKKTPAWQRGKYNGIGGKVEPGETPLGAMVREFREETGVVTEASDWTKFAEMERPGDFKVDVFWAVSDLVHGVETRTAEMVIIAKFDELCLYQVVESVPWLAWAAYCKARGRADFKMIRAEY